MHTLSSYGGNRPTHPQTHKQTHKHTNPQISTVLELHASIRNVSCPNPISSEMYWDNQYPVRREKKNKSVKADFIVETEYSIYVHRFKFNSSHTVVPGPIFSEM